MKTYFLSLRFGPANCRNSFGIGTCAALLSTTQYNNTLMKLSNGDGRRSMHIRPIFHKLWALELSRMVCMYPHLALLGAADNAAVASLTEDLENYGPVWLEPVRSSSPRRYISLYKQSVVSQASFLGDVDCWTIEFDSINVVCIFRGYMRTETYR